MMETKVFVAISVFYGLVLLAGVIAWSDDRKRRDAAALVRQERATNQLKIQLNREREERRAFEGYYILDDTAALDPDWQAAMRYAMHELDANDPNGTHS